MTESIEKQQSHDSKERVDPENVLYRDKEKEKLENGVWTSAILEDVKLFKSYEFRKYDPSRDSNSKYHSIQSFTNDENPQALFEKISDSDDDSMVKEDWSREQSFKADGVVSYKNQKYEYRERMIPVAIVSRSGDTGYKKRIKLDQMSREPLDLFNSLSDRVGRRVVVGNSRFGGTYLSTNVSDLDGERVTFLKRTKIIAAGVTGVFLSSLIIPAIGSILFGLIPAMLLALAVMGGGLVGTAHYAYNKTDYLYNGQDQNWLYDIPDDAAVRELQADGELYEDFEIKKTDIESYNDGTMVLNYDDKATWTIDGNVDGTPSDLARTLVGDSGIDMVDDSKRYAIAKKSDIVESGNINYYESDNSEYVLAKRSEYKRAT